MDDVGLKKSLPLAQASGSRQSRYGGGQHAKSRSHS